MLNSLRAMMGGKGFRAPKQLTRKQREEREKGQAFLEEYKAVCARHGKKLDIVWQFSQTNGPEALLAIVDHQVETKQQVREWSAAMRENLEVRSNCKHIEGVGGKECSVCGLSKVHWSEDGVGVTPEYKATQEEDIQLQEGKEVAESGIVGQ